MTDIRIDPRFQAAAFQTAAAALHQAPPDRGFEVAFAGRSNAGKSSAINALCHQRQLARTSKTPGHTKQIVFFRLDDERRLVDLPGYGFARVSLAVKSAWQRLMSEYLHRRRCLRGLILIMDIRHPLTELDRHLLTWTQDAELPVRILLTKADKLTRGAIARTLSEVSHELASLRKIEAQAFSAHTGLGLAAAQDWIGARLALSARVSPDSGRAGESSVPAEAAAPATPVSF